MQRKTKERDHYLRASLAVHVVLSQLWQTGLYVQAHVYSALKEGIASSGCIVFRAKGLVGAPFR